MQVRFGNATFACVPFVLYLLATAAHGQEKLPQYSGPKGEPEGQEGAWELRRLEDGSVLSRRLLELQPAIEASPALSIQLLPDDFHAKEGNAAIFYLQAMGFFEQSNARRAMEDFNEKNFELSRAEGRPNWPPDSWREMRPEEIPLKEAKDYLVYTSFQTRYLNEAVKRKRCDFNRFIREVDNPVMYLLPEIQAMRNLARTQSLRFLVAIAEDRVDDAVSIFGQQLAMGVHLSQEPFLVSNLVGLACASIGWYDSFYICEQEESPNLYWAIASLPTPLIEMRASLAFEREFLFEQFKMLREVDETPKSELYWKQFVPAFSKSMEGVADESDDLLKYGESAIAMTIAAGVPSARRYLLESEGMSPEALDTLPNTQVFFLATRRYYEQVRDEMFKIAYLPPWKRSEAEKTVSEMLKRGEEEYGAMAYPSGMLLPAVRAAMTAQNRMQQSLALLQTVESIRDHLASHNGQLPRSLEELHLPAPLNPSTGKPFEYVRHSEGATLDGSQFPGYRLQLELRTQQ